MKRIGLFLLVIVVITFLCVVFGQASELTAQVPLGPYVYNGVGEDDLAITFSAATIGETTASLIGNEVLLLYNSDTIHTATVTIQSVTDEYGARGDISNYILTAGGYAGFYFGSKTGWDDGSGVSILSATNSTQLALLRITKGLKNVSVSGTPYYDSTELVGPYPSSVPALALELTANAAITTATTFSNGGRSLLVLHAHDADSPLVTVTGQLNKYNRTPSLSYQVDTGTFAAYLFSNPIGWSDGNGLTLLQSNSTLLKVMVLTFP